LTEEDIRMGKKLELIENLNFGTKGEQKIEARMNYYKNLKPRTGVFKTEDMDATEEIAQQAHK
jgi:hypothetical protein